MSGGADRNGDGHLARLRRKSDVELRFAVLGMVYMQMFLVAAGLLAFSELRYSPLDISVSGTGRGGALTPPVLAGAVVLLGYHHLWRRYLHGEPAPTSADLQRQVTRMIGATRLLACLLLIALGALVWPR